MKKIAFLLMVLLLVGCTAQERLGAQQIDANAAVQKRAVEVQAEVDKITVEYDGKVELLKAQIEAENDRWQREMIQSQIEALQAEKTMLLETLLYGETSAMRAERFFNCFASGVGVVIVVIVVAVVLCTHPEWVVYWIERKQRSFDE